MHLTVGKVQPSVLVSDVGQPEVADGFALRLALDDRIVDGFYCARSLERLQHWLAHPEALAQPRPTRSDLVVGKLWERALETPEGPAARVRDALPDVVIGSMLRETTAARPWGDLLDLGFTHDDGEVERRLEAIQLDDPAVAVFTSGTSGQPRAALLTHRNLMCTATNALSALQLGEGETAVSYLPLSHVAEQNFTIVVALVGGASVAYAPSRGGVVDTLREFRPTVFFGVPQIWARLERELDGDLASIGLDRVKRAISGAAALDPSLFEAFAKLGLPLLQLGDARPGTCGPAFPGVDLRIADDGEVLFRGGNVFLRYGAERRVVAHRRPGRGGEWPPPHPRPDEVPADASSMLVVARVIGPGQPPARG